MCWEKQEVLSVTERHRGLSELAGGVGRVSPALDFRGRRVGI